ncbi:HNH endonuclease signature motif containing protein [Mycobacteroides abscessus]|uniref:HNH endonuclease signature motif containing protein n=2 Tax=Mycobacteroides abscessus TaxID=36809 RepID=UPI00092BF2F2|nr:HNH endonuclease signature motif containing protein [Mycobacteroides abscessus]MDB2193148.1 HNH endonuclease signature motif containing protein [Mycobacteroides abscessus subsp. abscessus]MDB2200324.1 HNH endonuclease signature motif containing protein [Mycobacteroides abscessus subsp. abscessus]MDM2079553.1 HNH endonuclease signature motif containing protein [Mycobacteroides abscessus]MDM2088112.1 HNH endonuclease signature motif containing protein [Mycobacteroides abscessus]MDM3899726.1 H
MSSIGVVEAAVDAFCAESIEDLTAGEALAVLARLEVVQRRLASRGLGLISAVTGQASPMQLGGTSYAEVLSRRLHMGKGAARRRIADAELLAPRRAITGEQLAPQLPHTAQALGRGDIGEEHLRIIRHFFDRLPVVVDAATREAAEAQLAVMATQFRPEALRVGADRMMALLNPDGQFSDADRARRRGITIGPQGFDGMSAISGLLDPETRAYLDAVFAKLAAPGMCNPNDQSPLVDGQPADDAAERDTRTVAQRHHDALRTALRSTLVSTELGSHHGLPVTVVVTTTLKELEDGAGIAITGAGTRLPMRDLIRMATHAHHYLAIFDDHGRALYLGRSQRIASPDQRLVLHARDRGCTHPDCHVPGYLCQAHHITEWVHDGPTDIDNLTFACAPHHRLLGHGWTTRKRKDGTTVWIPPPQLALPGETRHDDIVDQCPHGVGSR